MTRFFPRNCRNLAAAFLAFLALLVPMGAGAREVPLLPEAPDRSPGSPGAEAAADFILAALKDLGMDEVGVQEFEAVVPAVQSATLAAGGETFDLHPWGPNLATLPVTPPEGVSGPLLYAGRGDFGAFDGKTVQGSIVLLDMGSGRNWLNAAAFGASAVVFLGAAGADREQFLQKNITSPLAFPRFWISPEKGQRLKELAGSGEVRAAVQSRSSWQVKTVRNCYGFLRGKDPERERELVVLEAPYDAYSPVLGAAPGADESVSASLLLSAAGSLSANRPERSALFLFTGGSRDQLAGARQFVQALSVKARDFEKEIKRSAGSMADLDQKLDLAARENPLQTKDRREGEVLAAMISERAKDQADAVARRQREAGGENREAATDLKAFRELAWITGLREIAPERMSLARKLLAEAVPGLRQYRREVGLRISFLRSSLKLRKFLDGYSPVLFCSVDLSSRSRGLGLAEDGGTYPLQESIRRTSRAARLRQLLARLGEEVARDSGLPDFVARGETAGSAEAWGGIASEFRYGSDVAAIAGLPAVALISPGDRHPSWFTPSDTSERLDQDNLGLLGGYLSGLLSRLLSHPYLHGAVQGGIGGFSTLSGQAMYVRSGELFPDQPAHGTIVSVFQGRSIFRTVVGRDGSFAVPGLADNRLTPEKAILESYRLDPESGRVSSAVDRVKTRKENYRVRLKGKSVSVSLVMFRCGQTDIVPVFNPSTLGYLIRSEVYDADLDSTPIRYWSSRLDGRDNMTFSVFLEKGTRFKLAAAESLLTKEFLLLNSSSQNPEGAGFPIGNPPTIPFADLQTAKDLHVLVGTRLAVLSGHGIANRTLEALYKSAGAHLEQARGGLDDRRYSRFREQVIPAWAQLDVVYREADRYQRDVLAGVIFFIALFVPFAYCMERYLFGFRSVYRQIVAFLIVLMATILLIRALHPAFQLTYSPMVVILAFFIVGLSLGVAWIIFMRFEREMALRHGPHYSEVQHASRWQAFGAGFSIGVSNLNRRKLRTALTCTTLVILTFTIMSFTNIKSSFRTVRSRIADEASYQGLLVRSPLRLPLTLLTLEDLEARFRGPGFTLWPRAWMTVSGQAQRNIASVSAGDRSVPVEGILGMGAEPPDSLKKILVAGRWFSGDEPDGVLLSEKTAERLGIDPGVPGASVQLMGSTFRVMGVFDSTGLESFKDLDQNPIVPAYPEAGQDENISEAEAEAMQSGEQILPVTVSYRYADAGRTVLIPFQTCIRMGGGLEAISVLTGREPFEAADRLSSWLAYPIFVGDGEAWYQSAGTALRYQGAANLLIPILIVVLITLNTMISHVYERKREIGTYTSVGLAPAHVGFLFIVEALSLGVISTVIGYIVAQLSAHFLAGSSLFSQLTFNYSSLASIVCMFLVFSVVFLAALYPARVATNIAMPDVNRIWRLPDPEGDLIRMNLPFLLKLEEERGLMGFLHAFLLSHGDSGHGSFTVEDTHIGLEAPLTGHHESEFPVCVLSQADVWLAPFDFGIKQRVQIHCCPSRHDPGYLEIAIFLTRLSGERSSWVRANRNFVKSLRKQILLWRLLDPESKAAFISGATWADGIA